MNRKNLINHSLNNNSKEEKEMKNMSILDKFNKHHNYKGATNNKGENKVDAEELLKAIKLNDRKESLKDFEKARKKAELEVKVTNLLSSTEKKGRAVVKEVKETVDDKINNFLFGFLDKEEVKEDEEVKSKADELEAEIEIIKSQLNFLKSQNKAKEAGVPEKDILRTKDDIDAYFRS